MRVPPLRRHPPLRPDDRVTTLAPPPRRRVARTCFALAVLALTAAGGPGARATRAGEPGAARTETPENRLNADRRRAIERGCAWIATRQVRGGSFGDNKTIVAVTALSALALLSEGSGMDRGPHGKAVESAIGWLVDLILPKEGQKPDASAITGYFRHTDDTSSKMHGQGYAMLALASALGTARGASAERIRRALKLAVACAENAQTTTGGWGYEPRASSEHEGSVTVTIAHGLRAARDAGLLVSDNVVKHGLDYLRNSQKLVGRGPQTTTEADDGSFKYSLNMETSSYALTAAAISSFILFGEYGRDADSKDRIQRAIAYMKRKLSSTLRTDGRFFYYGHFYAAWAAWQFDGDQPARASGESWGDDPTSGDIERSKQFWGPWHAKMFRVLIDSQADDGRWTPRGEDVYGFGDLLPTAFAVLTLAVPDELLPILQR